MARPKSNAQAEGGTFKLEDEDMAPVIIEPAVATSGGHAMASVKVKITVLKCQTSAGSMRQYWQTYLPEAEANKLIAEGKAELCR
jgi:hypothetical protein